MILKYIRNSFQETVEYLNVPSDVIMNRQIDNGNDEAWVIVLNSDYYKKNYNTIFGKCQQDALVQVVTIDEWTFIFLDNIKPYGWVSMPDEVFKNIGKEIIFLLKHAGKGIVDQLADHGLAEGIPLFFLDHIGLDFRFRELLFHQQGVEPPELVGRRVEVAGMFHRDMGRRRLETVVP